MAIWLKVLHLWAPSSTHSSDSMAPSHSPEGSLRARSYRWHPRQSLFKWLLNSEAPQGERAETTTRANEGTWAWWWKACSKGHCPTLIKEAEALTIAISRYWACRRLRTSGTTRRGSIAWRWTYTSRSRRWQVGSSKACLPSKLQALTISHLSQASTKDNRWEHSAMFRTILTCLRLIKTLKPNQW